MVRGRWSEEIMISCVAVFRSKPDVFSFLNMLRLGGVACSTTGTPKEAGIGCGIAVRFPLSALDLAKRILARNNFSSFYAIFKIAKEGNRSSLSRIL